MRRYRDVCHLQSNPCHEALTGFIALNIVAMLSAQSLRVHYRKELTHNAHEQLRGSSPHNTDESPWAFIA